MYKNVEFYKKINFEIDFITKFDYEITLVEILYVESITLLGENTFSFIVIMQLRVKYIKKSP